MEVSVAVTVPVTVGGEREEEDRRSDIENGRRNRGRLTRREEKRKKVNCIVLYCIVI